MAVTSGFVMVKLLGVFVVFLLATTNAQIECGKPVMRRVLNQDSRRGSIRPTRQETPQNQTTSIIAGPPKVFCGATVISENFLLTTATCVSDSNNPINSVILGDLNILEDNEENSQAANYAIKQITIHPGFNPNSNTKYNDVALLQTEKLITFNEYVFPYCLSNERPPPGTTVTGAGFGLINETHSSGHLQEADLEVVETKQCESKYQEAGEIQRLKTAYPALLQHRDVLCAGFPGRGACKGDEGGPLFREDNEGRRYLVGVISFTGPCHNDTILPGVYTSVADHLDFINSVIYEGF